MLSHFECYNNKVEINHYSNIKDGKTFVQNKALKIHVSVKSKLEILIIFRLCWLNLLIF